MVIMQNEQNIDEAFYRLQNLGINFNMVLPNNLIDEYINFNRKHMESDY